MSLNVVVWLMAALLVAERADADTPGCPPAALTVLASAAEGAARGHSAEVRERLTAGAAASPDCRPLAVALAAWRGWLQALVASDKGGTPETLAPVVAAAKTVQALGTPKSDAAYAAAILQAAAAAAQDERDEVIVWLEEARDVSSRLAMAGPAPVWPLPFDVAEGELWHGVDDYELAEAAFARAVKAVESSPAAWRGLARARDRRGNKAGACEAYRRVQALVGKDPAPSPIGIEARGYLLLCTP